MITTGDNEKYKQKIYFMQRKGLGMLLAAAAAFGYFKYRKMSPDQKKGLHQRGRSFIEKYGGFKNIFGKKTATVNTPSAVHTPTY